MEKKEEDAAKTLLVLGSSGQEDPCKGMPKLADPCDSDDGGSDDEDEGDGDEKNATKKGGGGANLKKAGGSTNVGTRVDGQGASPSIGSAPVLRTPCKNPPGCSPLELQAMLGAMQAPAKMQAKGLELPWQQRKTGSLASTQYLAVTAELDNLPGWTDKSTIKEAMGKRNKRSATQMNRSDFGGQAVKKYRQSKYSYKLKAVSRYYADIAASGNAGCRGYGAEHVAALFNKGLQSPGDRKISSCC